MISKEKYNEYVRKLVAKKDNINLNALCWWYRICAIIMLIVGVVISIWSFPFLFFVNTRLFFVLGMCLVIFSILMLKKRKKTLKIFREDIRVRIIKYLLKGNSYRFESDGYISSDHFAKSQFSKRFDCCDWGDFLETNIPNDDGSRSKINFQIADVRAYTLYTDENGNSGTTDVYKGVFGYVKFSDKFKCILTVNSNFKRKGIKLEDVVLENIEFNEKFKIRTDNQVEARYILTPNMMEKLLILKNKIKNVKIVFIDNCVYIGAEKINMFELDKYKDGDIVSVFENLYDEIEVILGIVDELKNNNKVFIM